LAIHGWCSWIVIIILPFKELTSTTGVKTASATDIAFDIVRGPGRQLIPLYTR
jgi:hypothetical protein